MNDGPRKRIPIRWLSLGEIVGLAAVVIAALGYWDTHREHRDEERARAAAASREQKAQVSAPTAGPAFLMTGAWDAASSKLRLAPVHADQVIQTQTVWFPRDIRPDSIETTGNPRIEAGWLGSRLPRGSGKARQGRVPVGIATVFIEDGQNRTDRAIYMLAYSLHPRLLRAPRVELEGVSLNRRDVASDLQTEVDGLWASRPGAPQDKAKAAE